MTKSERDNSEYEAMNKEFAEIATGIISYYRKEFGDKLKSNKLILKLSKCGNKRCRSCPHGPYFYRAIFIKQTRKWVFKYIGNLTKGVIRNSELESWDRYKFYNDEIKRIKKERKERLKEINKRYRAKK